jgi:curved DNA-binding protein CbpA
MSGIFTRLTRGRRPLSVADKHRLVLEAMDLLHEKRPTAEIATALRGMGASVDEATALVSQGQAKFGNELVRSAGLPVSARYDLNYYFLLGVTPVADPERIHRAYRRKARDVHPDRHHTEFTRDYWTRLMSLIADAEGVLGDPTKREAYDVVWRERSREVAALNRRRGERRGDWETRYRWDIAELSEHEDEIAELLVEITGGAQQGRPPMAAGTRLLALVETYESSILEIRTNSHGLPAHFLHFGGTVRNEMQRKERLVSGMTELGGWLVGASGPVDSAAVLDQVSTADRVIEDIRLAMNQFDIAALNELRDPSVARAAL